MKIITMVVCKGWTQNDMPMKVMKATMTLQTITACNTYKNYKASNLQNSMKLKITIGEKVLNATLSDNPTTKEFISLLPLTLTLTDYNGIEKISDLPKILFTNGAP